MKKAIKIVAWAFLALFVTGCLMVGSIVYIYETAIDKVLSPEQQQWLYESMEKTEPLPEKFYQTMEKYYSGYFDHGVWNSVYNQFAGKRRDQCQCREIYMPFVPGKRLKEKSWIPFNQQALVIALELEERFDQKKCFAYNLNISDFGYNKEGVKQAAGYYYGKSLEELMEREIVELSLMQRAPSTYNPIRNQEKLEEAVNSIINGYNSRINP